MKRFFVIIIVIVSSILGIWCLLEKKDFFLICNSYLAAPAESEYTVCLTYFYPKQSIDFEEIYAIEFAGTKNVEVQSFEYYELENNLKYNSIALELKLHFGAPATEECTAINMYYGNQEKYTYEIGDWLFDIGEKEDSDLNINIWESPVASSELNFPYYYVIESNIMGIKNANIQYAKNKSERVSIENDNSLNGSIPLYYNVPMSIIRPKLVFDTISGSKVVYGNSCYCGALDITEEDIKDSYKFNVSN